MALDIALQLLLWTVEKGPEPEDVKAGWTAFALFGLGIAAVAVIGWFLNRSLKRAGSSAEEGRYDPNPRKQPPRDGHSGGDDSSSTTDA